MKAKFKKNPQCVLEVYLLAVQRSAAVWRGHDFGASVGERQIPPKHRTAPPESAATAANTVPILYMWKIFSGDFGILCDVLSCLIKISADVRAF